MKEPLGFDDSLAVGTEKIINVDGIFIFHHCAKKSTWVSLLMLDCVLHCPHYVDKETKAQKDQ